MTSFGTGPRPLPTSLGDGGQDPSNPAMPDADLEVWEQSARETLLHRLPIRASLIALVGTGLSASGAGVLPAAATGCTEIATSDPVVAKAAMESATPAGGCIDLTLTGPVTIAGQPALLVQRPVTVRGETLTLDTGLRLQADLTLAESATVNGVLPARVQLGSGGYLAIETPTVVVSGPHAESATIFSSGDPSAGTMIGVLSDASLRLDSVTLDGNFSRILIGNYGDLTVEGSVLRQSDPSQDGGGAIYSGYSSSLFVDSSVFEDNGAVFYGGAIYASGAESVIISNSTFRNNRAVAYDPNNGSMYDNAVGGAVYAGNTDAVLMTNVTFTDNFASDKGGAVYLRDVRTVAITNSNFEGNSTQFGGGGAIYVGGQPLAYGRTDSLVFQVSGGTFVDNTAKDGGAIYTRHLDTVTIDSDFEMNVATYTGPDVGGRGGAIHARDLGAATITSSRFESNTARGYFTDVSVEFYYASTGPNAGNNVAVSLHDTSTTGAGGAVYLSNTHSFSVTSGSLFAGNLANRAGGAIAMVEVASTRIEDSSFTGNEGYGESRDSSLYGSSVSVSYVGTGEGGAIAAVGIPGSGEMLTIYGSSFTGNLARGGQGGALVIHSVDSVTVSGAFANNFADQDGGALAVRDTRDGLQVSDSQFSGNEAGGGGGGAISFLPLYSQVFPASEAGSLTIQRSLFANNLSAEGGGAVAVYASPQVTIETSTFSGNEGWNGGAVDISGNSSNTNETLHVSASTFESNTANRRGGALEIENLETATVVSSVFGANTAYEGGALSTRMAFLQVSDSTVHGNSAFAEGGAIHAENATLELSTSTLSENDVAAEGRGGALRLTWSSGSIVSSTLFGNYAGVGGAISSFGSDLRLAHSTVAMNTANEAAGIYASHAYSISYGPVLDGNGSPVLDGNGSPVYDVTSVDVVDTATVAMSHTLLLGNVNAAGDADDFRQLVVGQTDDFPATPAPTPVPVLTEWTHSLISSAPAVFGGTFPVNTVVDSATVLGDSPALATNEADGGPVPLTMTLALADTADNPAVDAGGITEAGDGIPLFDQRGTGFSRIVNGRIDIGAFELTSSGSDSGSGSSSGGGSGSGSGGSSGTGGGSTPSVTPPTPPLVPTVLPALSLTGSTLTCAVGEFSVMPSLMDVTLIVGGVRQETRRLAMPATSITWTLDSLWRGQSLSCEVVAREGLRAATVTSRALLIPAAVTPTPMPTPTPTPTPEPVASRAGAAILFAPLSAALDAADRRAIAALVERAGTDATFRVTGYVQGTRITSNDRSLSSARARAVAAELRRLGVADANITTVAGGRSTLTGAEARRVGITARWTR